MRLVLVKCRNDGIAIKGKIVRGISLCVIPYYFYMRLRGWTKAKLILPLGWKN